ncbi:hypothetical protein BD408DRAFT_412585 [Parasitella parasitica]|nr:hypothetical protein BD408DRAFT_412585 [Parasitella parasitica]
MPRPLSDSWQYFELLSSENGRKKKAKCSFCGHEQAAGITRLHHHLLYRCSMISPEMRDQLRQKQDDRNGMLLPQPLTPANCHADSTMQNILNPSPASSILNPHSNYFDAALSPTTSSGFSGPNPIAFTPSIDNSNQRNQQQRQDHSQEQQQIERSQAMLDWHLARALFSANISYEKIENPHVIEFLKRLQPNYVIPKAKRLQQFLLKEQHWDLIPCIKSDTSRQIPSLATPPYAMQQQPRATNEHMVLPADNYAVSPNSKSHAMEDRLFSQSELEGSL